MILITLGTQDKQFYRLLEAVEKQINEKIITDEVIVQAGYSSDFKSKKMKIFDLLPMDEFDKLMNECDVLITHGGVGSIISGLKRNKKVIAAARLKEYGEHTNNHQLQIIENFSKSGYIIELDDFNKIGEIIKNIDKFIPKKYISNNEKFKKLVEKEIDKYLQLWM